jgi:hypothetical protein
MKNLDLLLIITLALSACGTNVTDRVESGGAIGAGGVETAILVGGMTGFTLLPGIGFIPGAVLGAAVGAGVGVLWPPAVVSVSVATPPVP